MDICQQIILLSDAQDALKQQSEGCAHLAQKMSDPHARETLLDRACRLRVQAANAELWRIQLENLAANRAEKEAVV